MKKLIVVKNIGFCFGVKRTVNIALKALGENRSLSTLGDIVHNPLVMKVLKKKGLKVAQNTREVEKHNCPFIIRSHGLDPEKIKKIKKKGKLIYDATCPSVKNIHLLVKELDKKKYFIIIIGDKNHPEVQALKKYKRSGVFIFQHPEELNIKRKIRKLAVIGQTTLSFRGYLDMVKIVSEKINFEKMVVYNTICKVTEQRQTEALELSSEVEMMLVLGGKNSSNTKKLFQTCRKNNKNTHHIEKIEELNKLPYNRIDSIGITSGTSTPEYFIEEVIKYLKKKDFGGV
jgi:4-hydroxy-3-methylbut-2-en-1-yl diphosphate reductase